MSINTQNETVNQIALEKPWKSIYIIGGVTAVIVIIATLLDIIIGSSLVGDLATIPHTAIERFTQLQNSRLFGLYTLDMLNLCTAVLLIPTYFALYAVHRKTNVTFVMLAMLIYFIGTAVFITNNAALPMLELSTKYAASSAADYRNLLVAAGEAMLAKGAHGSIGVFPGFILSSIASVVMSLGMLKGGLFGKVTAYIGIIGGLFLSVYLVLVTFFPGLEKFAIIIAAPGGLLFQVWMILFTIKLLKIGFVRVA